MTHQPRHLPRSLAAPAETPPATPPGWADALKRRHVAAAATGLVGLAILIGAILGLTSRGSGDQTQIDQTATRLLAGIPQHDRTLGYPNAPVTLEVFADLKDPDSRAWWNSNLPAIIQQDVRSGLLQLHFHAYKTNTRDPIEFVREQTAALAAGAQNELWDYVGIFYHQQRNAPHHSEFEPYVTNSFLESVARQTPGLNLTRWQTSLHAERREEQPGAENKTARQYQLHVTPSFRIGHTGRPLTNFSGKTVLKYPGQHPIALITAQDLKKAIKELDHTTP
jgi:hypothetical protein